MLSSCEITYACSTPLSSACVTQAPPNLVLDYLTNLWKHLDLWRNVVCLFCLSHWDFSIHNAFSHTLCTIGKLLMSIGASSWFCQVGFIMFWPIQWRNYWILNNLFMNNSFKSKLNFIREFGPALDIVRHSISKI